MMTAAAMLPSEGRRWGDRDDNGGEEEVVEVRWTTTTRPSWRREVAAGERAGSRVFIIQQTMVTAALPHTIACGLVDNPTKLC